MQYGNVQGQCKLQFQSVGKTSVRKSFKGVSLILTNYAKKTGNVFCDFRNIYQRSLAGIKMRLSVK